MVQYTESYDAELSDEEEIMLHGRCHLFAIALNELTGLPLAAYLDGSGWEDDDGDWVEGTVLVHAFVRCGETALDVRGWVP